MSLFIFLGEFVRWYAEDEAMLQKVLYYYQMSFSVGFVIGPGLFIFYASVAFKIGNWEITSDNFLGILLALLICICLVATIFGVSNISQDISKQEDNQKVDCKEMSLKDVVTDNDIMSLILSNGIVSFFAASTDLLIPMVSRNNLKLTAAELGTSYFVSLGLTAVFMLFVWNYFFTNEAIKGFIFCLFLSAYSCVLLLFAHFNLVDNIYFKEVVMIMVTVCLSIPGFACEMVVRELIFQIIPTNSSSYVEGIRSAVSITFFPFLGFLLAFAIFDIILYTLPTLTVILCLLAIPLYRRMNVLHQRSQRMKNIRVIRE